MNKRGAINRKRDELSGKAKMRDKKMDRARAVMHGGKNGDKEKSETNVPEANNSDEETSGFWNFPCCVS